MLDSLTGEILHAHLVRLLAEGALSIIVGWRFRGGQAFGLMTVAWGFVDSTIAAIGLRSQRPPSLDALRTFLAFNLGLDFAYIGVGLTMAALAGNRTRVRGFGQAIVVQGVLLLWLDGMLWASIPTPVMLS